MVQPPDGTLQPAGLPEPPDPLLAGDFPEMQQLLLEVLRPGLLRGDFLLEDGADALDLGAFLFQLVLPGIRQDQRQGQGQQDHGEDGQVDPVLQPLLVGRQFLIGGNRVRYGIGQDALDLGFFHHLHLAQQMIRLPVVPEGQRTAAQPRSHFQPGRRPPRLELLHDGFRFAHLAAEDERVGIGARLLHGQTALHHPETFEQFKRSLRIRLRLKQLHPGVVGEEDRGRIRAGRRRRKPLPEQ